MRHPGGSPSTSSLGSDNSADDASIRQSRPSLDTALSSAPNSSSSSITSVNASRISQSKRSSLKSSLKTSGSASALAVRFSLPEPPPEMPGPDGTTILLRKPILVRKDTSYSTAKIDSPTSPQIQPDVPARPTLRHKLSKRFSAPVVPHSKKESHRASAPPPPLNTRTSFTTSRYPGSRVTSFQSTASAPPVLLSAPSPSQPPSQYNPLQHYVPCLATNCKNHYTPSLLGPTFFSPQQPYKLIRKRGLCPSHANQNLKAANYKAKTTFESMRQNAGRKTLGLIAAEFELYLQELREERAEESRALLAAQQRKVLGSNTKQSKSKTRDVDEEWSWRYSPRPCTKKGCEKEWYSPFDNRLYLFYNTPRPSGLMPLSTLCPTCAREDVQSAENKVGQRKFEADGGPEWKEWFEQIKNDRAMEVEFWERAQERVVREKAGVSPVKYADAEEKKEVKVEKKKDRLKGICIIM